MAFPTHIVAVGGLVEDNNENVLMVKTIHGGWVFPGGQVEMGENLLDALIREIKEESGIDVAVSHLIGVYSNSGMYKWHDGKTDVPTKVMLDFVCNPIGGQLTTSEETTDCKWVPRGEVLHMIQAPAIQHRYQAYLDTPNEVVYTEYLTKPEFAILQKQSI